MHIEARTLGRRDEPERRELSWPGAPDAPTVGDLIAHVVREEVTAYNRRERDRRLLRVLTEDQIRRQASLGKVAAEVREHAQPASPETSVEAALEAFADGLFLVFIDDEEVASPDVPIEVHDGLRVRFVRMVPLAGGCA